MTNDDPGLFEIMRTCRAMRRLKPDPVPEELLVRLVEAAQWGRPAQTSRTAAGSLFATPPASSASPS
ncbi:MAG: hypothetical protein AB7P33_18810 [Dehalococcoidia bacterium]